MDERFETYLRRVLPEALKEGAAAPAAWDGSAEDWEGLRRGAALVARWHALEVFVREVSLGIRPDELASGTMVERHADGTPVRPPEPTLPLGLEEEARAVLRDLTAAWLSLPEPPLQVALELAGTGRWQGEPRRVVAAIGAAKGLLQKTLAQREAAQREAADRPVLTVSAPFRGPGGASYAPGAYPVDPAAAAELAEWGRRMEAQAKERGWPAPVGYDAATWPPFTLARP